MRRGRRYRQRVCCRHGKAAGGIEIRNSVRHRRRMPDAAKGPGMTPRMWLKTGIRKIINNQLQWGRDDSPDVARLFRPPSHGLSCFNGAGDGSPDITAVLLLSLLMIWRLQWSRGSLPGCNVEDRMQNIFHRSLQWGRGSLPGCNGSSVLARPGAACKGMDRRPVVLCPAADSLPCPLQEKALFFQSGCTSEKGTVF